MRNKLRSTVILAAALAAVPAIGSAQNPEQQLSIDASRDVVTFGKQVQITGTLTGGTQRDVSGQNVTLRQDLFPYEGRYERLDQVDTDDNGNYSFTHTPTANAKYKAFGKAGTESPEVTVLVRAAVALEVSDKTPRKGKRVTFEGTVAPEHDGKKARIQRRTDDGWRTMKKAELADAGDLASTYSERVRIRRSGRYRVSFRPGDGDHEPGKSRKVRIRVG